jgi:hypothetical protein
MEHLPKRSQVADCTRERAVRRYRRECERPEPSNVWQTSAFAFLTCAAGVGIAAVTRSADAAIRTSELWIVTVALIFAAALCLIAHRDVNRGRKSRIYEIEEDLEVSDEMGQP